MPPTPSLCGTPVQKAHLERRGSDHWSQWRDRPCPLDVNLYRSVCFPANMYTVESNVKGTGVDKM